MKKLTSNEGVEASTSGSADRPRHLERIACLLLPLNVGGFVLASYLPGLLSMNNRPVSVAFRALFAGLCVYLVWSALRLGRMRKPRAVDLLAIVFWSLYLTRFAIDTVINPVSLGMSDSDFFQFLIGTSFLTFIAFSAVSDMRIYRNALHWIAIVLACDCLFSYFSNSYDLTAGTARDRLGANAIINPITYGHIGVTAAIIGLFLFLGISKRYKTFRFSLFGLILMLLGMFALLSSAARGPLVAGVVLLLLLLIVAFRHGAGGRMVAASLFMAIVVPILIGIVVAAGVPIQRYFGSASAFLESNSTAHRESLESLGWKEFVEHPILGSSMVERESLTYPHNFLIESFMATGLVGGTAFSLLLLIGLWRSLTLLYRHPEDCWISLLFLHSMIAGMFSGGLFCAPWFWGMLAIMLSASHRDQHDALPVAMRRRPQSEPGGHWTVPVGAGLESDAITA